MSKSDCPNCRAAQQRISDLTSGEMRERIRARLVSMLRQVQALPDEWPEGDTVFADAIMALLRAETDRTTDGKEG